VTSLVLDVNGLSIRMGTPYGRRPPARGEAGVSLLAETPVVPAPYGLKLNCRRRTHPRLAVRRGLPVRPMPRILL
jgi:hypothetical protein